MTEKQTVLVTGGAGYIGSHAVLGLLDAGWSVVVVDNLSTGHAQAVPAGVPLIVADIANGDIIDAVLREHNCVAIMHFAGSIVVPESVSDPLKYYKNNTASSRTLIERCVANKIHNFIFSSAAAVYGVPNSEIVSEASATQPINPYGTSKLMTEWMLRDTAAATPLRYAALRYFNVAGADPLGRSGQRSENATHLIKVACEFALGKRPSITVFGNDYDTRDGTCVRDYIHVADLAAAHILALNHLVGGGDSLVLNCGYGRGASVHEVLRAVEAISGTKVEPIISGRRPGDPPSLVADSRLLRRQLNWQPRHEDLNAIVRSAFDWERQFQSMGAG